MPKVNLNCYSGAHQVSFLRYTQQWSKKVVFVLNKSDIYQNKGEVGHTLAVVILLSENNFFLYVDIKVGPF